MGKPVRIRDLARPAERLYEELLIGNNVMGTEHPSIMRAEEDFLPWEEMKPLIDQLWTSCQRLDCTKAREALLRAVVGYSPTRKSRISSGATADRPRAAPQYEPSASCKLGAVSRRSPMVSSSSIDAAEIRASASPGS